MLYHIGTTMIKKNDGSGKNSEIDARIISLSSRDISSRLTTGLEIAANAYYSFSYYDQINVLPVETDCSAAMGVAYKSIADGTNCDKQFILAFTDIVNEKSEDYGYTKEQIETFWNDNNYPLFFLTMVNLTGTSEIEKCLKKIKSDLKGSRYMAYLTYDHCDIIIFCREENFNDYAQKMLKFSCCGENAPVGTVTLYGFYVSQSSNLYGDDNQFHALIRMGTNDYSKMNSFYNEVSTLDKDVEGRWFLERKGVGFYCSNATILWLYLVREKAKEVFGDQCDITYELLISVENNSFENLDACFPRLTYEGLKNKLKEKYADFSMEYTKTFNDNNLTPDRVWLRWLNTSLDLTVSFIKNYLSMDLGTCLIPQFIDLLDYGRKFFKAINEGRTVAKIPTRDTVEAMSMSFSKFFSYIAILIDSMNQSDRQFLQIPPFHLPSFEVPPKIMEYYVAVAYKLKKLLQDDKENFYGLLITPQFINKLGVKSLANQMVLKDDQWLEIVISESSFYSLQATTNILGHEISHYVGKENRCREQRKEYILKFAYSLLVYKVLVDIRNEIEDCVTPRYSCPNISVSLNEIIDYSEKLYEEALCIFDDYALENYNYLDDMKDMLYLFADRVLNNPSLFDLFFDFFRGAAKYEKNDGIMDFMLTYQKDMLNLDLDMESEKDDTLLNNLAENMMRRMIYKILSVYIDEAKNRAYSGEASGFAPLYYQALDYFKETFADLQSIMIFDLDWLQYCEMVNNGESENTTEDVPQRMFAVAKVLIENRVWDLERMPDTGNGAFDTVKNSLMLNPVEDIEELGKNKFNGMLLFYLCGYLNKCYDKIKSRFTDSQCKEVQKDLNELKELRDVLSGKGVLETQKKIGEFVDAFRQEVVGD